MNEDNKIYDEIVYQLEKLNQSQIEMAKILNKIGDDTENLKNIRLECNHKINNCNCKKQLLTEEEQEQIKRLIP